MSQRRPRPSRYNVALTEPHNEKLLAFAHFDAGRPATAAARVALEALLESGLCDGVTLHGLRRRLAQLATSTPRPRRVADRRGLYAVPDGRL
jgi:hypothetical protein